jgi:hypothetical protein
MFISSVGQNWTLKDSGAGLIVTDGNENQRLKIIRRNSTWDARDLSENGALKGKYNGNQLFAAWIQGPETKDFLNNRGIPVWMYRYKITSPDGKTAESEPKDFFAAGYSFFAIEFESHTEGVWKIEWFIFNRNTQQTNQVATTVFQTTWGKEIKRDPLIIKNK